MDAFIGFIMNIIKYITDLVRISGQGTTATRTRSSPCSAADPADETDCQQMKKGTSDATSEVPAFKGETQ